MKHILITGATGGIGRSTAEQLAEQGHRITIHGRSATKLQAVRADITAKTGNANIDVLLADFSSLKSVAKAASTFLAGHETLDVLINNAGVSPFEKQLTRDGFEMNFGVNTLATLLLTKMLLPLLKQTPKSRIVFVASDAYVMGKFDADDLDLIKRDYKMVEVYGTSKLYSIYLSNMFSDHLKADGISVNALHPGVVRSALFDDAKGIMGLINKVLKKYVYLSPENGARTSVFVATSDLAITTTGKYFKKSKTKALRPIAQNKMNSEMVWARGNVLIQPFLPK